MLGLLFTKPTLAKRYKSRVATIFLILEGVRKKNEGSFKGDIQILLIAGSFPIA